MDARHVWDDGTGRDDAEVLGEWLLGARVGYDSKVPPCSRIGSQGRALVGKQSELVGKLNKLRWDGLVERSGERDRARLKATALPNQVRGYMLRLPARLI